MRKVLPGKTFSAADLFCKFYEDNLHVWTPRKETRSTIRLQYTTVIITEFVSLLTRCGWTRSSTPTRSRSSSTNLWRFSFKRIVSYLSEQCYKFDHWHKVQDKLLVSQIKEGCVYCQRFNVKMFFIWSSLKKKIGFIRKKFT